MSNKIKIVCIVGPTASGKTSLGVGIAKVLDGEVVSADSMQIYKGMSIASAAPTSEEMQGVPHHLTEFLNYGESFSVSDYVKAARGVISDINLRGKLPIIVGGTGLYINSLVDNIEFIERKTDLTLRKNLQEKMERVGAEVMLEELRKIDPQTSSRLHPNDKRRIIRAFEIYESSGITVSGQNEISRRNESPYDSIMIGVTFKDRQKLYDRINRRVDAMISSGLVSEAETAYNFNRKCGASQAIGHKELFGYFDGEISLDDAIDKLKQSTRRYAKRQLTWFNRDERIKWVYADETPDVISEALSIIREEWQ